MAKNNQNDCVSVYYGINMDSYEVQSVWVTRGGGMSCGSHSHTIMLNPASLNLSHAKELISQLKAKAAEMKQNNNSTP